MQITREQIIQALIACEDSEHMSKDEIKKFGSRELAELRTDDLIKNLEKVGVKERSRPVKAEYGFQRGNYYCSLIAPNGNILFHGSGWNTIASMMKAIAAIQESEIVMVNKDLDDERN